MKTTKHSAGPWNVYEDYTATADYVWVVETSAGEKLRLSSREARNGFETAEANARLIAAAPAMHQRLEFARRLLLQGDAESALREVEHGLAGDYEG